MVLGCENNTQPEMIDDVEGFCVNSTSQPDVHFIYFNCVNSETSACGEDVFIEYDNQNCWSLCIDYKETIQTDIDNGADILFMTDCVDEYNSNEDPFPPTRDKNSGGGGL